MGGFISVIVVLNPLYNASICFLNTIFKTSFIWAYAVINYVILTLKISFVFNWKIGWQQLITVCRSSGSVFFKCFLIWGSNLWPCFPEYGTINCNVSWVSLIWGFVVCCHTSCQSSWSIILLTTLSEESLHFVKIFCR